MGDYFRPQQFCFYVATLTDGGRACPVEAVARAPTQAEADAQVAWDFDDIQCLVILSLYLSPNLRTHFGNTAHLTWDSLNTTFGQPGVSAITLKVTGGQNLQVEIQQLNTLFKHLTANGMVISDPMQGIIMLNILLQNGMQWAIHPPTDKCQLPSHERGSDGQV